MNPGRYNKLTVNQLFGYNYHNKVWGINSTATSGGREQTDATDDTYDKL